jgi:three-Cys-motif partner protein
MVALPLLGAAPSSAEPGSRAGGTGTDLDLTSFHDMEIDTAHDRVFVSGGPGSPHIVIRCVREHTASGLINEVVCVFIETDKERVDHLAQVLSDMQTAGQIPAKCKPFIEHGTFDEGMTKVLDIIDEKKTQLAPAFVMIDPFGVSDTPMSVIERLFKNDKVEFYVSFMYEYINRFKGTPEFEGAMDKLFGTTKWREGIEIADGTQRKLFFFDLYEEQLRAAGAKYVLRFELYTGDRLKYAIFFGTTALLGIDKMKQVIWRIAPTGDFAFRGGRSDQLTLGAAMVDFQPLLAAVESFLQAKSTGGWVGIAEVNDFVVGDTDYHSGQYKTNALKVFEKAAKIELEPGSRKKAGTYPDGTRLRWKR